MVEIGLTDMPKIWGCHGKPGIPRGDTPTCAAPSELQGRWKHYTSGWGKVRGQLNVPSRLRLIHSNFKLIIFDLDGQIFSIFPPTPPPLGYVAVQSEHNSVLRAKSSQDWRTCVRNMKLWVPTNIFLSNLWVPHI